MIYLVNPVKFSSLLLLLLSSSTTTSSFQHSSRYVGIFSLSFPFLNFVRSTSNKAHSDNNNFISTDSSSKGKMQRIKNDGIGGRGVTFTPTSGNYNNVVIWMHGLGDTADGWASMMPTLGIQDTKFILPTANSRPITINGGMPMPGWSDILGLDISSPEDKSGFADSAERINRIIQTEVDKGVSSDKIIVAGFSQGGALALHVSLRFPLKLGGCVALSTWLPLHADYPSALSGANSQIPILQVHGDEDRVVAHNWGLKSHEQLKTLIPSPLPNFATIEGMGHSSDPEEMDMVTKFIKKTLGI